MEKIRNLDDLLRSTEITPARRRLLVVDDKIEVVDGIRMSRLARAYEIVSATNGREGLDLLARDAEIGVVLLDMLMPVMGGEEFLKELRTRRDRHSPFVRVIVYTAFSGRGVDHAEILKQYGPIRFLTKTTDPAVLEAEVRNAYTEHDTERSVTEELTAAAGASALVEIARNVAHDLRSPLSLASSSLEYLRRRVAKSEPVDPESLEEAHGAVGLAQQRISLLEQLAGASAEKSPSDLGALIGTILRVYDRKVDKEGFTVETRFDPDLEPVMVSAALVNTAVTNLLENSLQFARPGSRRIEIETFRDRSDAVLRWTDHGMGIAAGHLDRVFDPGWTTRAASATEAPRGLGLASVRRVMEFHGGSAAAASEVGRWTTFTLRFPLGGDPITPSDTASPEAVS